MIFLLTFIFTCRRISTALKKDFSEVELCQIDFQKKKVRKNKSFGSLSRVNLIGSSSKNGKLIQKENIETGNVILFFFSLFALLFHFLFLVLTKITKSKSKKF